MSLDFLARILMATMLLSCLPGSLTGRAHAADINTFQNAGGNGVDVIEIRGTITQGDFIQFVGQLKASQRVLVALSSDGGSLRDALSIGMEIRLRGFSTTVVNDNECYSACALIWLAGSKRFMSNRSKIGFHAAYILKDGMPFEKGAANAEIGHYLTRLGYNLEAIVFITDAPPDRVELLSFEIAAALDIEVYNPDQITLRTTTKPAFSAEPPSFDCKKATRDDEIAICQNAALAKKDNQLAQLFERLIAGATQEGQKFLRSEQRLWLVSRRNCRADVSCIIHLYDQRLSTLSSESSEQPPDFVSAPSFDCTKASSQDELVICRDPLLSQQDQELAALFGSMLAKFSPEKKKELRARQRDWILERRSCGDNLTCVKNAYNKRIEELQNMASN